MTMVLFVVMIMMVFIHFKNLYPLRAIDHTHRHICRYELIHPGKLELHRRADLDIHPSPG